MWGPTVLAQIKNRGTPDILPSMFLCTYTLTYLLTLGRRTKLWPTFIVRKPFCTQRPRVRDCVTFYRGGEKDRVRWNREDITLLPVHDVLCRSL